MGVLSPCLALELVDPSFFSDHSLQEEVRMASMTRITGLSTGSGVPSQSLPLPFPGSSNGRISAQSLAEGSKISASVSSMWRQVGGRVHVVEVPAAGPVIPGYLHRHHFRKEDGEGFEAAHVVVFADENGAMVVAAGTLGPSLVAFQKEPVDLRAGRIRQGVDEAPYV
jgi:hypothetical protein